jgi:hypothetical protein
MNAEPRRLPWFLRNRFAWLWCWLRGFHLSPPDWGWLFVCGGFEVWCWTCGRPVRGDRFTIKPHPKAYLKDPRYP